MIDELKLRRDEVRGARAKALLEDELLKEALDGLEADYTKALFLTKPGEEQSREKLYLAVNVVRKVRDHLGIIVQDGVLASRELRDLAGGQPKMWSEV